MKSTGPAVGRGVRCGGGSATCSCDTGQRRHRKVRRLTRLCATHAGSRGREPGPPTTRQLQVLSPVLYRLISPRHRLPRSRCGPVRGGTLRVDTRSSPLGDAHLDVGGGRLSALTRQLAQNRCCDCQAGEDVAIFFLFLRNFDFCTGQFVISSLPRNTISFRSIRRADRKGGDGPRRGS
jgi:hypothetical protein